MTRKERALAIADGLQGLYPDAGCLLDYGGVPYRLLLSTILSAQTTDESVNRVTPRLWKAWPDLESLSRAPLASIEEVIHPLGFFRSKARLVSAAAAWLLGNSGGEVPDTMDRLLEIPGVGRKTANVALGEISHKPAIIVDTHVKRLSFRMGLTSSTDPDRIEEDLGKLIPPPLRTAFSHRMGAHGRRICAARKPRCSACLLLDICPRKGLAGDCH